MSDVQWNEQDLPVRPGVYFNFVDLASDQIRGGVRGVVALALRHYQVDLPPHTLTKITDSDMAEQKIGKTFSQPVFWALQGGAKEVLVYTLPTDPLPADYETMRMALDTQLFHVFCFGQMESAEEQEKLLLWIQTSRKDGKPFLGVVGCTQADEDADPTAGNARSIKLKDSHLVNVISGVSVGKKAYSSAEFSPWIAGIIAGTGINQSITYRITPAQDILRRLTPKEANIALESGSLIFLASGDQVKIEQGITTTRDKIRSIRTRQSIIQDIKVAASDAYIGNLQNNEDGQASLIALVMAYLERLEANSALKSPLVKLDPNRPSTGDAVFLLVSYVEVDSMERIFFTINL